MGCMYECAQCEHVQLVGVIDNGLPGGFADPDTVCEHCGAVGRFHFAPGTTKRMAEQAADIARYVVDLPNHGEAHDLLREASLWECDPEPSESPARGPSGDCAELPERPPHEGTRLEER